MFEKDEERKKTMEETWKTVSVPGYLTVMEKLLVTRGGKHFAGNEVQSNLVITITVLTNSSRLKLTKYFFSFDTI
jgi:hypothetical protein